MTSGYFSPPVNHRAHLLLTGTNNEHRIADIEYRQQLSEELRIQFDEKLSIHAI